MATYELGTDRGGNEWILCRICLFRSYHPKDIDYLYCGRCHRFHPDASTGEMRKTGAYKLAIAAAILIWGVMACFWVLLMLETLWDNRGQPIKTQCTSIRC